MTWPEGDEICTAALAETNLFSILPLYQPVPNQQDASTWLGSGIATGCLHASCTCCKAGLRQVRPSHCRSAASAAATSFAMLPGRLLPTTDGHESHSSYPGDCTCRRQTCVCAFMCPFTKHNLLCQEETDLRCFPGGSPLTPVLPCTVAVLMVAGESRLQIYCYLHTRPWLSIACILYQNRRLKI